MRVKKSLLLKLHLYCGLFTCCYILTFGVSSIILNHGIQVDSNGITKSWEERIEIDEMLSNEEVAAKIRDDLGLMGWIPPWRYKKDKLTFAFIVTHTGKVYHIHHNFETDVTQVEEAPKGFISVLHGMHFFNGKIPNAPLLLRSFAVYQWMGLFALLLSLIFGIWIWLKYSARKWELILFGAIFTLSTIVMSLL